MSTSTPIVARNDLDNDDWTCYPCTVALIVLTHAIYFLQTARRVSRQQVLTNYYQTVRRGDFYRLWLALLSHPPHDQDDSEQPEFLRDNTAEAPGPSPLEVETGNTDAFIPVASTFSWVDFLYDKLLEGLKVLKTGHLSGFPLLLYNSHLLWSSRALEYGQSWRHARFLVLICSSAMLLELYVLHWLMHRLLVRYGDNSPHLARRLREVSAQSRMGTLTACATAVLILFEDKYSHVAIPIVPFITRQPPLGPALSLFCCVLTLSTLSRPIHWWGMVMGSLVAAFWLIFQLDAVADSVVWSGALILGLLLGTLVSLRHRHPMWVPCIDRTGLQGSSSVQHFVLRSPELLVADDSGSSVGDGDSSDTAEAFPPLDDEEIYSDRLVGEETSSSDEETRRLLSSPSNIRSRRATNASTS